MNISETCNNDIVHKLFTYLMPEKCTESDWFLDVLSLYKPFMKNFIKVITELENEQSSWKFVTVTLQHLTILQRTFKMLPCDHHTQLFLQDYLFRVLDILLRLSNSLIKIVQFTSNVTISCMFIELNKKEDCVEFQQKLTDYIFSEHKFNASSFGNLIVTLITELKPEFDTIPCCIIDKIYSIWQQNLYIFCTDKDVTPSTVLVYEQLLDVVPKSSSMFSLMLKSCPLLIKKFSLQIVSHKNRLTYLKVLKGFLPFPSIEEHSAYTLKIAEEYLETVHNCKKSLKLNFFSCPDFVGFGGRSVEYAVCEDNKEGFSISEKILVINGMLSAACLLVEGKNCINIVTSTLDLLLLLCNMSKSSSISESMLEIFLEQDDAMIEMLLLHLALYASYQKLTSQQFLESPHLFFVALLRHLAFDSSVLLDWLTSNETQFLLYFLKYLKYLAVTFDEFRACTTKCDSAEQSAAYLPTLSAFRQLHSTIEKLCSKNLFPYNVKPLIKNMLIVLSLAENSAT